MYRLFAAAQAIEFSEGCHARWSNFVVKSKEFPLASTVEVSAPVKTFENLYHQKAEAPSHKEEAPRGTLCPNY